MKNHKLGKFLIIGIAVSFAVLCTGAVSEAKIKSVKFKKKSEVLLGLRESTKLSIKVKPAKAKSKVMFKSSRPKVVKVTSKGKITGRKIGTATIYAKAKDGSKKKAKIKVRVIKKVKSVKLLNSAKRRTVRVNTTFPIQAAVLPKTATRKKLKWYSSSSKTAQVSSQGIVTAKRGGTTTITAKATDGTGKKVSCKLKVVVPVSKITIKSETEDFIVREGYIMKLSSTVSPSNASEKGVIWSTSDKSIATVDSDGVVTGVRTGSVVIKAKAKDDSGVIGSAKVEVVNLSKTETRFIAHRGLSGLFPENTVLAYREAVKAGYWGIECDVRMSSDGEFIICHDATFERLCGDKREVAQMTAEQIQSLFVTGVASAVEYPNQWIPTLDEYLRVIQKAKEEGQTVQAVIELKKLTNTENQAYKEEDLDRLVAKVDAYGLTNQVTYISFVKENIEYLRAKDENVLLQYIVTRPTEADVVWCIEKGVDLSCDYRYLQGSITDMIHAAGRTVSVWTVNNFYDAFWFVRIMGVDYLSSNYVMFDD